MTPAVRPRERFRRMSREERDYVWIYAWGALWAISFFVLTPDSIATVYSRFVTAAWTGAALIGGVMGVIALFSRDNLLLERLAVRLLIIAPPAYSLIQLGVVIVELVQTGETQRAHLILFGMWPFFFLRKRHHHLTARVREAKATPLPSEEAGK